LFAKWKLKPEEKALHTGAWFQAMISIRECAVEVKKN
jgi:hypothetical protein